MIKETRTLFAVCFDLHIHELESDVFVFLSLISTKNLMSTVTKWRIIIVIIALIQVISVQCIEHFNSPHQFGLHTSADDASYYAPGLNWVETGTWRDNSIGNSAYVQRPPILGFLHAISYKISSKHRAIVFFQFAFLLHLIASNLLFSRLLQKTSLKNALLFSILFVSLPCFWGYLSYQLTEAISGSLVIIGVFIFTRKNSASTLTAMVVFLCILYLFRPILLLLFFPIVCYLFYQQLTTWNRFALRHLVFIVIGITSVVSWEIRKKKYMDSWFDIHPIYSETNGSLYRPLHHEFSQLFRIWEYDSEQFHRLIDPCWHNKPIKRATVYRYVQQHTVPLSGEQLYQLLNSYQQINVDIHDKISKKTQLTPSINEIKLQQKIEQLRQVLIQENHFTYYVTTPIKSILQISLSSHLNQYFFHTSLRDLWIIVVSKICCLLLITISSINVLFQLIKGQKTEQFIAFGIMSYWFYLFLIQRLNEERYLVPTIILSFYLLAVSWRKQERSQSFL